MVKLLFGLSGLAITVILGGLYFYQNKLIYQAEMPTGARTEVMKPSDAPFNMEYEDVEMTTPDGVKIKGYLMLCLTALQPGQRRAWRPDQQPTVILFHGNAGNIGHRLPISKTLTQLGLNVFQLSYRGYGLSEGSPSEKGLKIDAETAWEWVSKHKTVGKTKKVIFGQSIGGALAAHLTSSHLKDVSALILENTFTDLPSLIPTLLPPLSFLKGMVHQIWPTGKLLSTFPASLPILLIAGEKDEIVPHSHMLELRKISGQRKGSGKPISTFKSYPNGMHNSTLGEAGYFDETILSFLRENVDDSLPKVTLRRGNQ